ncbi:MAG: flagellar brake protein [Steroidobacteraceae bacterium]
MASFADMNLRPGQAVQLQLTRTDHARFYSLLIGYLAERAVIVTTPAMTLANDSYSIIDGDAFVCRAFAGRRAFAFQTDVLRVVQTPFPHLYLRYPQKVESVVVRKATRVPFDRVVSIVRPGSDAASAGSGRLRDLSLTGAGIEADSELARQGERIELVVPAAGEQHPDLRLTATVRKLRAVEGAADAAGDSRLMHFGLEFVELTSDHTRGLQEIIQHQLLDDV